MKTSHLISSLLFSTQCAHLFLHMKHQRENPSPKPHHFPLQVSHECGTLWVQSGPSFSTVPTTLELIYMMEGWCPKRDFSGASRLCCYSWQTVFHGVVLVAQNESSDKSTISTSNCAVAQIILIHLVKSTTYDQGIIREPFILIQFEMNLSRYFVQLRQPFSSGSSVITSPSLSVILRFW